jgi:hypothetical protein
LPTNFDGGQSTYHGPRQEPCPPYPEQAHPHEVSLSSYCSDRGQIILEFVETGKQLADILTKPLGRLWFSKLKSKIGMVELKSKKK